MVVLWHERFKKDYGWLGYLLLGAGVIRLISMLFPMNEWNSVVPPQPWSLIRNLPLMLQGLGVAHLFLRDASKEGDRIFFWIGIMILVSYACYIPVILLVQQIPPIGMLMIPKTMAYVAVGFLAFYSFYKVPQDPAVCVTSESPI